MKIKEIHLAAAMLLLMLSGCGQTRRLNHIRQENTGIMLTLPQSRIDETSFLDDSIAMAAPVSSDTMTVNIDGHEMVLMKAIKDEETGEMVAHQELQAAFVTARFRNVAERHGNIDLEFEVRVPQSLVSEDWQLRFYPQMRILEDTVNLEKVIVTGSGYRKEQLRGYERYERFLSKIVSDTTKFIDLRNLEIFLQRNMPQIYYFKTDSSYVSEQQFLSYFGVSEKMAIDHYTNRYARKMNERRIAKRDKMYAKYVKSPIVTTGVRLDTVIRNAEGDFVYTYVQPVRTRKGLKKIDISLQGEMYQADRRLYSIPETEPLTYYVSSISSFVNKTPRYLTRVIERQAEVDATWQIEFKAGGSDIDFSLGENAAQMDNISRNLRRLMTDDEFVLDSITIAAYASPEGSVTLNNRLCKSRAGAIERHFDREVRMLRDSIDRTAGMLIVVGDDMTESSMSKVGRNIPDITFKSLNGGENWSYLDVLVENDERMNESEKAVYSDSREIRNLDDREQHLKSYPFYAHMKKDLYPKLRNVQFRFFLHRRDMVKDTVHTTVLDSVYMAGVQMLEDRDYEGAVSILGQYNDYNAAIAYVALDRNISAMNILEKLPETPQVNYMMAVVYSRFGEEKKAVERYLTSCRQDGSYVHRGNLDPEIAALIRKYNLNAEPEDEFDYGF
ncbi:MAG: hypothetical protein IJ504_01285 [Bacteroidales bacterium]|nr:hypothetical protein [Bacteroidales bacterium]